MKSPEQLRQTLILSRNAATAWKVLKDNVARIYSSEKSKRTEMAQRHRGLFEALCRWTADLKSCGTKPRPARILRFIQEREVPGAARPQLWSTTSRADDSFAPRVSKTSPGSDPGKGSNTMSHHFLACCTDALHHRWT
jgi:hypothetical protein